MAGSSRTLYYDTVRALVYSGLLCIAFYTLTNNNTSIRRECQ